MDASSQPLTLSDANNDVGPRKFFVAGVEVEFPMKPYKCQISTMNMVIRGLRHMTNTLVESPTGSGKTLSLICASLAWQKEEAVRLRNILEKEAAENAAKLEEEGGSKQDGEKERLDVQVEEKQSIKREREEIPRQRQRGNSRGITYYSDDEDDDDDFQKNPRKAVKMRKCYGNTEIPTTSEVIPLRFPVAGEMSPGKQLRQNTSQTQCNKTGTCQSPRPTQDVKATIKTEEGVAHPTQYSPSKMPALETGRMLAENELAQPIEPHGKAINENVIGQATPAKMKIRVPKIFYCSRTHQQIQQVVRELGRTVYKDTKMTILASREHTCIQKSMRPCSKTELCLELLDPIKGRGCMYKNSRMSTHKELEDNCNLESPWDLEDLVKAGLRARTCPYFGSRDLVSTADIVFCPYVYLIDPKIRKTMQLNLHGAVILLDEAHNIEECCRDAASYSVSYDEIYHAMKDCKRVASLNVLPAVHNTLVEFLNNVLMWMSDKVYLSANYHNEKEKMEANTWDGVNSVASFEEYEIISQTVQEFKTFVTEAIMETNKEDNILRTKKSFERHGIVSVTCFVLEGLALVLGFMYDNNMEHMRDYHVVMCKNAVVNTSARTDQTEDWKNTSFRPGLVIEDDIPPANWGQYLNFLCMNSGVVFRPIAETVRSIVLTSGTLAPLVTFHSELDVTFTNEIQALHIVEESHVWVGTLGHGPTGRELNAGFRFIEQPNFKEELGNTILHVCKIIPYGVLCFLPSYSMLESLRQHLLRSGIWDEMEYHKELMCEIKGNKDFLSTIQTYYDSVRRCELGVGKGPLLFAILRGKVSEGLDFADNRARGVITVGIPYPHVLDVQVKLKRKYNDVNVKRGLKSGAQWYETQAYRALNQALGRCIRHKNDWGALILIDKRFLTEEKHVQGLSKWIRRKVQPFSEFGKFHSSLRNFIRYHNPELPDHG